VNILNKQS